MPARLSFRLRQHVHDLRVGLFFVPMALTAILGITAVLLVDLEVSGRIGRVPGGPLLSGEPTAAQSVLGAIAGSMMSVISIVYSVLVVALSLASSQYSPRIIGGYISDRPSQYTLGIFIGTFTYCLIVMRAIKLDPPRVPTWAVTGGIVLALASIGFLIFFIHNIASGIQASRLVERIAWRTERLVDRTFPAAPQSEPEPPLPADARPVGSLGRGYVQLVDLGGLAALADRHAIAIHAHARPGDFVAHGGALGWISPASRATPELERDVAAAFDLGSTRTLQQDVAFGVRQLVDCALRALSRSSNDPTTAVTCIDHIGDLLVQIIRRHDRARVIHRGEGLVVIPFPRFTELLDLGISQLRRYARADLTVSIRLLVTLAGLADACRDAAQLEVIALQAHAIRDGFCPDFLAIDRARFDDQFADCERAIATARVRCA